MKIKTNVFAAWLITSMIAFTAAGCANQTMPTESAINKEQTQEQTQTQEQGQAQEQVKDQTQEQVKEQTQDQEQGQTQEQVQETVQETTAETEPPKADLPADPTINPDNAQFWRKTIQKYRKDDNVHQLLLVRYTGGCGATAQFYEKSEYNNAWELTLESDVYVGKYGIGKTSEGDAKSPTADIGVRRAFGILPNPGTKLDYLDVVETTYACDEDCKYYNQIIDSAETGHQCTGEDMFTYTPEYNYGIESTFNDANKYPEGSAIFIHCKGAKPFTGGCIAFDQKDMKYILQHADKGMRIVIGEN